MGTFVSALRNGWGLKRRGDDGWIGWLLLVVRMAMTCSSFWEIMKSIAEFGLRVTDMWIGLENWNLQSDR